MGHDGSVLTYTLDPESRPPSSEKNHYTSGREVGSSDFNSPMCHRRFRKNEASKDAKLLMRRIVYDDETVEVTSPKKRRKKWRKDKISACIEGSLEPMSFPAALMVKTRKDLPIKDQETSKINHGSKSDYNHKNRSETKDERKSTSRSKSRNKTKKQKELYISHDEIVKSSSIPPDKKSFVSEEAYEPTRRNEEGTKKKKMKKKIASCSQSQISEDGFSEKTHYQGRHFLNHGDSEILVTLSSNGAQVISQSLPSSLRNRRPYIKMQERQIKDEQAPSFAAKHTVTTEKRQEKRKRTGGSSVKSCVVERKKSFERNQEEFLDTIERSESGDAATSKFTECSSQWLQHPAEMIDIEDSSPTAPDALMQCDLTRIFRTSLEARMIIKVPPSILKMPSLGSLIQASETCSYVDRKRTKTRRLTSETQPIVSLCNRCQDSVGRMMNSPSHMNFQNQHLFFSSSSDEEVASKSRQRRPEVKKNKKSFRNDNCETDEKDPPKKIGNRCSLPAQCNTSTFSSSSDALVTETGTIGKKDGHVIADLEGSSDSLIKATAFVSSPKNCNASRKIRGKTNTVAPSNCVKKSISQNPEIVCFSEEAPSSQNINQKSKYRCENIIYGDRHTYQSSLQHSIDVNKSVSPLRPGVSVSCLPTKFYSSKDQDEIMSLQSTTNKIKSNSTSMDIALETHYDGGRIYCTNGSMNNSSVEDSSVAHQQLQQETPAETEDNSTYIVQCSTAEMILKAPCSKALNKESLRAFGCYEDQHSNGEPPIPFALGLPMNSGTRVNPASEIHVVDVNGNKEICVYGKNQSLKPSHRQNSHSQGNENEFKRVLTDTDQAERIYRSGFCWAATTTDGGLIGSMSHFHLKAGDPESTNTFDNGRPQHHDRLSKMQCPAIFLQRDTSSFRLQYPKEKKHLVLLDSSSQDLHSSLIPNREVLSLHLPRLSSSPDPLPSKTNTAVVTNIRNSTSICRESSSEFEADSTRRKRENYGSDKPAELSMEHAVASQRAFVSTRCGGDSSVVDCCDSVPTARKALFTFDCVGQQDHHIRDPLFADESCTMDNNTSVRPPADHSHHPFEKYSRDPKKLQLMSESVSDLSPGALCHSIPSAAPCSNSHSFHLNPSRRVLDDITYTALDDSNESDFSSRVNFSSIFSTPPSIEISRDLNGNPSLVETNSASTWKTRHPDVSIEQKVGIQHQVLSHQSLCSHLLDSTVSPRCIESDEQPIVDGNNGGRASCILKSGTKYWALPKKKNVELLKRDIQSDRDPLGIHSNNTSIVNDEDKDDHEDDDDDDHDNHDHPYCPCHNQKPTPRIQGCLFQSPEIERKRKRICETVEPSTDESVLDVLKDTVPYCCVPFVGKKIESIRKKQAATKIRLKQPLPLFKKPLSNSIVTEAKELPGESEMFNQPLEISPEEQNKLPEEDLSNLQTTNLPMAERKETGNGNNSGDSNLFTVVLDTYSTDGESLHDDILSKSSRLSSDQQSGQSKHESPCTDSSNKSQKLCYLRSTERVPLSRCDLETKSTPQDRFSQVLQHASVKQSWSSPLPVGDEEAGEVREVTTIVDAAPRDHQLPNSDSLEKGGRIFCRDRHSQVSTNECLREDASSSNIVNNCSREAPSHRTNREQEISTIEDHPFLSRNGSARKNLFLPNKTSSAPISCSPPIALLSSGSIPMSPLLFPICSRASSNNSECSHQQLLPDKKISKNQGGNDNFVLPPAANVSAPQPEQPQIEQKSDKVVPVNSEVGSFAELNPSAPEKMEANIFPTRCLVIPLVTQTPNVNLSLLWDFLDRLYRVWSSLDSKESSSGDTVSEFYYRCQRTEGEVPSFDNILIPAERTVDDSEHHILDINGRQLHSRKISIESLEESKLCGALIEPLYWQAKGYDYCDEITVCVCGKLLAKSSLIEQSFIHTLRVRTVLRAVDLSELESSRIDFQITVEVLLISTSPYSSALRPNMTDSPILFCPAVVFAPLSPHALQHGASQRPQQPEKESASSEGFSNNTCSHGDTLSIPLLGSADLNLVSDHVSVESSDYLLVSKDSRWDLSLSDSENDGDIEILDPDEVSTSVFRHPMATCSCMQKDNGYDISTKNGSIVTDLSTQELVDSSSDLITRSSPEKKQRRRNLWRNELRPVRQHEGDTPLWKKIHEPRRLSMYQAWRNGHQLPTPENEDSIVTSAMMRSVHERARTEKAKSKPTPSRHKMKALIRPPTEQMDGTHAETGANLNNNAVKQSNSRILKMSPGTDSMMMIPRDHRTIESTPQLQRSTFCGVRCGERSTSQPQSGKDNNSNGYYEKERNPSMTEQSSASLDVTSAMTHTEIYQQPIRPPSFIHNFDIQDSHIHQSLSALVSAKQPRIESQQLDTETPVVSGQSSESSFPSSVNLHPQMSPLPSLDSSSLSSRRRKVGKNTLKPPESVWHSKSLPSRRNPLHYSISMSPLSHQGHWDKKGGWIDGPLDQKEIYNCREPHLSTIGRVDDSKNLCIERRPSGQGECSSKKRGYLNPLCQERSSDRGMKLFDSESDDNNFRKRGGGQSEQVSSSAKAKSCFVPTTCSGSCSASGTFKRS